MKNRRLTLTLGLILAALVLGLVALIASRVGQMEPEEVVLYASTPEPTEPPPKPEPTPPPTPTPTPYVSPMDFDTLHGQNEHIVAWLEIPGTTVSYPVLQHPEDDTYYLNRTVDGTEGLPGSIFVFSGRVFSRFNTVLYGHNMADGSMFGSLKEYRDMDYLLQHRTVILYTPEAEYRYKIFASTSFPDILINAAYDDSSIADRAAYLDKIYNDDSPEKVIVGDVEITSDDHIITLSTCVDSQPEQRRLVLALLEHIEPEWRSIDG